MSRSPIDLLVTHKTLSMMSTVSGSELTDYILQKEDIPFLKNVCTKVHPDLADRIDKLCTNLDIRKRQFCEYAFVEALNKAEKIMEDEGLFDYLSEFQEDVKKMKEEEKSSTEDQKELSL